MARPFPGALARKATLALPPSAVEAIASPAAPKIAGAAAGDAGSRDALERLNTAIDELKAQAVLPILHHAISALKAERHREGGELALKALKVDEKCGLAWHILAICREKAGDFTSSLQCYETALGLSPEDGEIANDLGRLAYRMGMKDVAEKLFHHYLAKNPGSPEGANNLACALRDQMRFGEAIDILRPTIGACSDNAMLWNTLATVLTEQGEMEQALLFLDESLRLDPTFARARYNRSNTRLALGDTAAALSDCEAAIPGAALEHEAVMMKLARSTMLIASGRLKEGWDAYEVRLDDAYSDVTHYMVERPRWTPEAILRGKHLLLVGEQGLGDEVLFANMLPDVIEALGPEGKLSLAVEPRLVELFQRSFPTANVGRHATYKVDHHCVRTVPFVSDWKAIDLWAPLASPLRRFRASVDAFPERSRFLTADPERVAYWRGQLAVLGQQPKVGIVWKSLKIDSGRMRFFSPFEQWRAVLKTPGLKFVNLQYGDCDQELADARERLGVEIWTPPGIDLKHDLDEVAALSAALDLVVGPANATTNIAAACGAPLWLISTPGAWPKLGTDRYPWYPSARVFTPPGYNRWVPVMIEVAEALRGFARD